MEHYRNTGGDSGIKAYEIGSDFIRVEFSDNAVYKYTNNSAGSHKIEKMKRLAQRGEGLNSYISTTVRKEYECKER